jgi:hypothetical protein
MDVFGNRGKIIFNFCAFGAAIIAAAETLFIEHNIFGETHYLAVWPIFIPVIVMLVVRKAMFSCVFLILYFILNLELAYQIWRAVYGPPFHYEKGIENWQIIFVLFASACFIAYVIAMVIRAIIFAVKFAINSEPER